MKLTKENLKRPVNMNFIMLLSLVVLLLGIAFTMQALVNTADAEVAAISQSMDEMRSGDEIGDVDGYAVGIYGLAYVISALAVWGIWVIVVAIPIAIAILVFVLALVARLVYSNGGVRLLIYRIIMAFDYIIVGGLVLLAGSILSTGVEIITMLLIEGAVVYLGAILFFGIRNTYSERIKY